VGRNAAELACSRTGHGAAETFRLIAPARGPARGARAFARAHLRRSQR
jgi:hypothetical protein